VKKWRHLDFWNWKTYIHARVPRTNCGDCKKVTQVPVKWSRPLSRFTLQFETRAMRPHGGNAGQRGHRYITLFLDTETKTVLYATEGKGKETLGQFKKLLTTKGVAADQIQEVCCDMSPAFIRGIEDHFPSAQITFDKFHVMKLVNEAVDDVRIEEQKQAPELKKTKYVWLFHWKLNMGLKPQLI
jgi:transposase